MTASLIVCLFSQVKPKQEGVMKVRATCLKCQYSVEADLEVEVDTNSFVEALRFLQKQAQEHHHPEVNDSFKWRLGWEGKT